MKRIDCSVLFVFVSHPFLYLKSLSCDLSVSESISNLSLNATLKCSADLLITNNNYSLFGVVSLCNFILLLKFVQKRLHTFRSF